MKSNYTRPFFDSTRNDKRCTIRLVFLSGHCCPHCSFLTSFPLLQVVDLPVKAWMALDGKAMQMEFVRKRLQDFAAKSQEQHSMSRTQAQVTPEALDAEDKGKEPEPARSTSSDRMTSERLDLSKSGATLSDSNSASLTRSSILTIPAFQILDSTLPSGKFWLSSA